MEHPMQKLNDLSRCLTPFEPDSTLIVVIEMSLSNWLVAGIVPGIERWPMKKLTVDESALLKLLHRWREEAEKAGHIVKRIAVAFDALLHRNDPQRSLADGRGGRRRLRKFHPAGHLCTRAPGRRP